MTYFYYFARKLYTIIENRRNYQSLKKINKLYRHAKLHFAEHNVSKSSQILEERILPMLKGLPKGSSSEWKKVYNEFHADLWQFRAALIAVKVDPLRL